MRDLIRICKSISDETRIRIVKVLLERKSLCVCEIMQALNITQTRASKNLRILKDAGFVLDKRKGSWVHYSINRKMPEPYIKMLSKLLKQSLNDDEGILKDKKRLSEVVKLGEVSKCKGR